MKRTFVVFALAAIAYAPVGHANVRTQTTPQQPSATGADVRLRQERVVGEATSVDKASGRITIKMDDGRTILVSPDEKTLFRRVEAGATSLENAERITRADVGVGDRLIVLWRAGEKLPDAPSQIVLTSRAALEAKSEQEREAARKRNLVGRITFIDAAKREFTVLARGRGEAEAVGVRASESTRFLRYAPDSLRLADAVAGMFADLKVGDQIRARGERSADGALFTAEEITSGRFVRLGGKVTAINAERGELTMKSDETGKNIIISVGKRSILKRVTDEAVEEFEQRRDERRAMSDEERRARREARRDERTNRRQSQSDDARGRRGGARGGNLLQMIESFPIVALADLKKGDALFVTATPSADDEARVTAVIVLTGPEEFLARLLRLQNRGDEDGTETGLPSGVLGGGNVNREPPQP